MRRALVVLWLGSAACFDLGLGAGDFACTACHDASVVDASKENDAGPRDAGPRDAGDAGPGGDAGVPLIFQRRIDVDTTGLTETLVDFPLLIRLDPTRIEYSETKALGADLRFYGADGTTVLDHEIERWVVGTSLVWVRTYIVPPNLGPTTLFMTYGDSTAIARTPEAMALAWNADHTAVLHFESGPTSVLANDIGASATAVGGAVAPGVVGNAVLLGAGEHVDLPLGRLATDIGSACAWLRAAPLGGFPNRTVLYGASELGGDGFGRHIEMHIGLGTTGSPNLYFHGDTVGGDINYETNDFADDDAWHQLCATWRSPSRVSFYYDGDARVTTPHDATVFSASAVLRLGGTSAPGQDFIGHIDEVRLSRDVWSDGWVWFQYRSVIEPNRFTFGAPVSVPRPR